MFRDVKGSGQDTKGDICKDGRGSQASRTFLCVRQSTAIAMRAHASASAKAWWWQVRS